MPNPTPRILELSAQFRAQLLARERAAATAMVRYYGEAWQRLQSDVAALRTETQAMIEAGEEISIGRIWRLERMEAIQRQVEEEMARFAEFASSNITGAQREAIAAGERNAYALARAAFPADAGIEINFAAMPRDAVESLVGFMVDGSPLVEVIQKYVGDSSTGFMEQLAAGLVAGWNPRKLARELRSQFGMGLTNALCLARTEQLRAYRAATLNSYQQNDNVIDGWERLAAHDNRTCAACLLLDGKQYTLVEEMDDHTNGRCSLIPRTKSYAELGIDAPEPDFQRELGKDWFLRQDEATQRTILGDGRYDAWKNGLFELGDLPKLVESSVWGNSWVPKSLKELVGEDAIQTGE